MTNKNKGLSTSFVLFIVFLVLKLTDVIDWSWWWVTLPLWVGWGILGVIFIGALLIVLLFGL